MASKKRQICKSKRNTKWGRDYENIWKEKTIATNDPEQKIGTLKMNQRELTQNEIL